MDDNPFANSWSYLVAAIICGVIGAAIGQSKKSSPWLGFCWGFVLGPIGWIIAAVILKPAETQEAIQTRQASSSPLEAATRAKLAKARRLENESK